MNDDGCDDRFYLNDFNIEVANDDTIVLIVNVSYCFCAKIKYK